MKVYTLNSVRKIYVVLIECIQSGIALVYNVKITYLIP